MKKLSLVLSLSMVLTGCGGGGGDDSPNYEEPPITNPKPEEPQPEEDYSIGNMLPDNEEGGPTHDPDNRDFADGKYEKDTLPDYVILRAKDNSESNPIKTLYHGQVHDYAGMGAGGWMFHINTFGAWHHSGWNTTPSHTGYMENLQLIFDMPSEQNYVTYLLTDKLELLKEAKTPLTIRVVDRFRDENNLPVGGTGKVGVLSYKAKGVVTGDVFEGSGGLVVDGMQYKTNYIDPSITKYSRVVLFSNGEKVDAIGVTNYGGMYKHATTSEVTQVVNETIFTIRDDMGATRSVILNPNTQLPEALKSTQGLGKGSKVHIQSHDVDTLKNEIKGAAVYVVSTHFS